MSKSYVVLFDYDSMIYKCVYKIASISDIKKWFKQNKTKSWMIEEIVNLSLNRLSNMSDAILLDIEETHIEVEHVEYFLTVCPKSKRKLASKIYKANRRPNKWVKLVRKKLIEMDAFKIHPEWEADDLIKDRAVELGEDNFVICTIDKDLKQISGIHFDYYRPILKNPDGTRQVDERGNYIVAPCRGLDVVSKEQAERFFWNQMLMGDSGDNIKGIPGIGKVKAKKILDSAVDMEMTVHNEYLQYWINLAIKDFKENPQTIYKTEIEAKEGGKKKGIEEFELHKLLIGLGVKHRP